MLPESERAQLRHLQHESEQLQEQLDKALADLHQHKYRAASRDVLELEIRRLSAEREQHERMKKVLENERNELQEKLDELTRKDQSKSPFPECSKIDERVPEKTSSLWKPKSLTELLEVVRARLADGVVEEGSRKKKLFYHPADLRLFIGGLAMSQLHIFQGPSGTGKTTLPSAFATAVGAGQKLIPVQAGWRDRTDLLGHWNAFERRFYETKFLQGLYESGADGGKSRPYFLILDEMNLSRVEQYFADVLSALEAPDEERRVIPVMAEGQPGAPNRFLDHKELPLGRNVWFIGTANHDETTIEFADKTYDRSFVHELPEVPPTPFSLPVPTETGALDVGHMNLLFAEAARRHEDEAATRLEAFGALIRKDLRAYDIVWAKRLERQAKRFVPVVQAAGGTLVEAFDHLLRTRLLRKIRRRHDLQPSDLAALREQYDTAFREAFGGDAVHGLELLGGEHARLDELKKRSAA
jgi:hypothetical protein